MLQSGYTNNVDDRIRTAMEWKLTHEYLNTWRTTSRGSRVLPCIYLSPRRSPNRLMISFANNNLKFCEASTQRKVWTDLKASRMGKHICLRMKPQLNRFSPSARKKWIRSLMQEISSKQLPDNFHYAQLNRNHIFLRLTTSQPRE